MDQFVWYGYAEISKGYFWRRTLRETVADIPDYRDIVQCQNAAGTRMFSWTQGTEGALTTTPCESDFPLHLSFKGTFTSNSSDIDKKCFSATSQRK